MRFESNSRSAAIAAVSAAVLVPLGVFGAPALARSAAAASEYSGSSQYQYKVGLCHHTHSRKHPWHVINVSSSAVKAHVKHGDTPAPCPAPAQGESKHGPGDSGDSHGQSGEHGKSGEPHGQSGSHGNGHGK